MTEDYDCNSIPVTINKISVNLLLLLFAVNVCLQ